MKTIRYLDTLFAYDGPQIFEARDASGGYYLALAVEVENARDRYLVVSVSPERLRQFRTGTLDLRSLLAENGEGEWYLATAEAGLDQPLRLEPQTIPLLTSGLLPDTGFVLPGRLAQTK